MTSGQKIAFSLLTTIVLAAGFVVTARSTRLFKLIDDRYYSQSQVTQKNEQLTSVAKSLDSYITNVLNKVEGGENAYVNQDCIRSYMDQNPSEALQEERRNLTAKLFNEIPSLSGIRLVDKNGKSVHYSSYDNDVLKINGSYKTYKNYPDIVKDSDELEFNQIKLNDSEPVHKVLLDSDKNRIIIEVPFNWIDHIYSATMLFYFKFNDVEQQLINEKVISYGQNIALVSQDFAGGIIINLPNTEQSEFIEPVISQWRKSAAVKSPEKILEMKDGRFWLLLSNADCEYAAVAGVYTSDIFQLPQELIYVIYGCVFLTIFLLSFLLFSFKRNSETAIKKRLKRIQYGIIKEYLDNKEKIEWSSAVKQLKTRKDELSGDIYSSLGVHSKKQKKHLDEFLEKSWAEIFEVLEGTKPNGETKGTGTNVSADSAVAGITMEQLRNMLEEVLQETSLNINVANLKSVKSDKTKGTGTNVSSAKPVTKVPESVEPVEDLEDVEELDEIEDAEPVEDVEELDEIEDAEPVEDVEELDEVEDAEPVEDVEELDEVEDAEPVEDVEELDEIEDAEPVEDVEELDEVEDAEPVEDVEELDEIEDAEPVEDVEELDEIEDAEPVEDVEELDEVEDAEPVEDVEELDEVEDAEPVEDVEELDEVEDTEPVEELDEVEDAEPVEELETLEEVPAPAPAYKAPEAPSKVAKALGLAGYQYIDSNDTFIRGDIFASTSNLFAEELSLGPEYVSEKTSYIPLEFVVYEMPKLQDIAEEENEQTKGTGINGTTESQSFAQQNVELSESNAAASGEVKQTAGTGINDQTAAKPARRARKGLLAAASALAAAGDAKQTKGTGTNDKTESPSFAQQNSKLSEGNVATAGKAKQTAGTGTNNKSLLAAASAFAATGDTSQTKVTEINVTKDNVVTAGDAKQTAGTGINDKVVSPSFAPQNSKLSESKVATSGDAKQTAGTGTNGDAPESRVAPLSKAAPEGGATPAGGVGVLSLEDLPSAAFSMTSFGANLEPVQDLESAPQEPIVEKNGLYQIASDLEYSEVKVDKSFQSLVDSVLK